ncbi:hypothetical protein LCX93_11075 [Sulfurimonas sp. SWIR-19]|uniref:type II secretion system protein GspD n=1 Tax=Sulfurimonas sp. SWIR-19 TaxID=2878390 RepID=UPI001CF546AC|nr:hypothetical protein [Sulfurimonas sp. SWIR-19]UCN00057.1 hypothetical protein LCX93_11075 [Sulfurimonas sp. SWIR-19]
MKLDSLKLIVLFLLLVNNLQALPDYKSVTLDDFVSSVASSNHVNIFIDEDLTKQNISFYIPVIKSPKILFQAFKIAIEKKNLRLIKKGNFYYLQKKKEFKILQYMFTLTYNCSDDFIKYLKLLNLKYTFFKSNNTFLVSCNYLQKEKIATFLKSLDKQAKQVMLKFIIISFDDNVKDEKGITLSNTYQALDGTVQSAVNSLIFPLSTARNILSSTSFYSAIRFLNSNNTINIKQFPYVLVQNNHKFKFESVQNIPYLVQNTQTDSNTVQNNNSYEYKDVGLKIYGTANILKEFVTLDLDLTIEDLINTTGDNLTPSTNKRYLNSITNLKYGQILLLSGIKQKKQESTNIRVPVLCNIPYLGKMFTYDFKTDSSSNITIAIEVLDSKANALLLPPEVRGRE